MLPRRVLGSFHRPPHVRGLIPHASMLQGRLSGVSPTVSLFAFAAAAAAAAPTSSTLISTTATVVIRRTVLVTKTNFALVYAII